jgi:hypothetical protein
VLPTSGGGKVVSPDGHRGQAKVLATIAGTTSNGWERRSVGPGAHGDRAYDWTAVALDGAGLPRAGGTGCWFAVKPVLARASSSATWRSTAAPGPRPRRYPVRDYRAWYAHITLAMAAVAYLAATRVYLAPMNTGIDDLLSPLIARRISRRGY